MKVRPAVPDDAMAVARVHVRAWQAAYRGVMTAAYLEALQPQEWARRYELTGLDPAKPRTLVALEADTILGFATYSLARDDEARGCGELCALYVEPDCWGRGIGGVLVSTVRDELYRSGIRRAVLWVVAGNARAERFYRGDGWMPDGTRRVRQIGNVGVDTVRYARTLESP